MTQTQFDYQLELTGRGPERYLGRVAIDPDWAPIRESVIFDMLRRGAIMQPDEAPPILIEPVWDPRAQAPHVAGLRAVGGGLSRTFPITYFKTAAQGCAARLMDAGQLKEGDLFDYRAMAMPRQNSGAKGRFSIVTRDVPLPIQDGALAARMKQALVFGGVDCETEFPVLIHWHVLQKVAAETRRAGAKETGGILLGSIWRDSSVPELFVEITDVVTVPVHGELTRLEFGPQTWTALRAQVDRRGGEPFWAGWWHSHSYTKMPPEPGVDRTAGRKVAAPFLSCDDLNLHRHIFPRALGLALLVTDSPDNGMSWSLFGWQNASIVARAFHVMSAPMPDEFYLQGVNHEPIKEPAA